MYAFLLINLINFSRHHKQHLHMHRRHLEMKQNRIQESTRSMPYFVRSLLNFLHFFSTYSRMVLSILMMAMTRDPNAMVPRWKAVAFHMAVPRAQEGRSLLLSSVQYH